ncbi:glycosyltransferase [Sporomusa sphaeroides DSM 2875]|uniref:glycosyltransferase n=1 Tax=Sporomusa sphaeroides TaxID=47679 RepID=UPI002030BBD3|nr:glycosyltransferase [Sporomusa sphaeroides]MCM0758040.1 glycosyltransferase [Sporomusa sphaeroides DSM 2875]
MSFQNKRMLIVASDFPFPPVHGGRVDVFARLKTLYHMGFVIDLIATVKYLPSEEHIREVNQYVKNIHIVHRANRLIDMFSVIPLQIKSRCGLKDISLEQEYDFVLLEGQYTSLILDNSTLRAQHFLLRIHNDEPAYFKQLFRSEKLSWAKLYYLLESYKFKLTDPCIFKKVTNMMFISDKEYREAVAKWPQNNCVFLPPSISIANMKVRDLQSKTALFIGAVNHPNNKEAIIWYVKNVHPYLLDIPDYKFIMAGNSLGKDIGWINELMNESSHIYFFDTPMDLEPLYQDSAVFVNPMLHGAGVTLKTVEAIQNGLPVVSTLIGSQGTGLRDQTDVLLASEPALFARQVRYLLQNFEARQRLVCSAQEYLKENFDTVRILHDYLSNIMHNGRRSI